MRASAANDSTSVASRGHEDDTVLRCADKLSIHLTISEEKSDKYPAKKHARKVALGLGVSRGLIYLVAKPTTLLEDSDQPLPFRQRRYFYYLSGVDEPDCYLTYDIKRDNLVLYVPDFNLRQAVWMGHTLSVEEAVKKYDVDEARYYSTLRHDISDWVQKEKGNSVVYVLHESQRPRTSLPQLKLDSDQLMPVMNACRGIKDAHEIALVRRANEVSAEAHTNVLRNIRKWRNEAEVEGAFLNTCISHRTKNPAYAIIAASGENAAVLHYTKNDEPFGDRQMMCLDAGAEFNCYASDVTRTFPLHGGRWPSAEAESIYRAVEAMQEECINRIAPGVRFLDLHLLAHMIAIDKLADLGILRGDSPKEIRESGASTVFFPHGLGHHVGLEVHDVSETPIMAQVAAKEPSTYESVMIPYSTFSPCTLSDPVLEPGMIVTVEPGIYFSRPALDNARRLPEVAKHIDFDVVEKYMAVGGVRIEDDILVTQDGYENLTTAPKGDKALEIIREGTRYF